MKKLISAITFAFFFIRCDVADSSFEGTCEGMATKHDVAYVFIPTQDCGVMSLYTPQTVHFMYDDKVLELKYNDYASINADVLIEYSIFNNKLWLIDVGEKK